MQNLTVADDMVVYFNYTLRDDEGNVLDSSEGDAMPYLHGAENIVPGLEAQMEGRSVGDKFTAVVAPEDGYGLAEEPIELGRDFFPEDVEVEIGMDFAMESEDGEYFEVTVSRIDGDTVWIDPSHPLAGVTLHFEVEITEIRPATAEEISHGHAHGPGGHHHH